MIVSIIIPVYNAEKFLEECLKSAINQTFSEYDIIAVDDGSTDNSLEILKKYSEHIKIFTKKNGGAASAMNVGIKQSSGEWIKRLDSDDVLNPNAVNELVLESRKIENKKNTILYANYDNIDSNGNIIDCVILPNFNKFDLFDVNVMLLDHDIGNEDTVLIHRSTFDEYGMYDETTDFEDYELRLRFCLIHRCRLHHVPKTVAKYRIHSSQTTKKKIRNSLEVTNRIRKSVLEKLDSSERKKYQIALKKYRKNKPFVEKCKYFVRYHLFPYLPTSVSKKLVNMYWYFRSK